MGPWEAACKLWVLENAQGLRKRSPLSLYEVRSERDFGVPPGPTLLMEDNNSTSIGFSYSLLKESPVLVVG